MKHLSVIITVAAALALCGAASAQLIPPGGSQFNPPMPPPPPSPKIEVPAIPQMDVPSRLSVQSALQSSFSDRVTSCLDQGAAAGLGPSDRAAYSRSCAN
jgi:hypothetical protein